jgi:uncharacterized YccA/Bax inhibitor family protein
MGIGVSLLLIAIGAILAFAVSATVQGIDLATVGVILMIVGAIGLLVDLLIWAPRRRPSTVADPYAGRTRVVEERESLR